VQTYLNQLVAYQKKLKTKNNQNKARKSKNWAGDSRRLLLLTESNPISQSQIFPFFYYLNELDSAYNIQLIEKSALSLSERETQKIIERADIVFFQPWFKHGADFIERNLALIRQLNSSCKLVFLDAFAPLDLRFSSIVNEYIDFYFKKNIFKDSKTYSRAFKGDNHLIEFYNQQYGITHEKEVFFDVPDSFFEKLHLAPGFFTSHEMLPSFASYGKSTSIKKQINVHARLGAKGVGWYQKMRQEALLSAEAFKNQSIITSDSVGKSRYWKELKQSKICFSPFGYGEVCWRDFEAVLAGALLIKPDMSHVENEPNIFKPFETYIPVAWDFSDVPEKIEYYLSHEEERLFIVNKAYEHLNQYVKSNSFINQFSLVFV
jgi:hypothetical protein